MEDIVIVSAARTAVGKFGGSLAKTPAVDLGAIVIREAIARAGLSSDQIGEVIMGQVLAAGVGQNPARQASIAAGLPKLRRDWIMGRGDVDTRTLAALDRGTGPTERALLMSAPVEISACSSSSMLRRSKMSSLSANAM